MAVTAVCDWGRTNAVQAPTIRAGIPIGNWTNLMTSFLSRLAVIGRGHLGLAIAERLHAGGHEIVGPLARDWRAGHLEGVSAVLLCVPDDQIATVARRVRSEPANPSQSVPIGHCSGATSLSVLGDGDVFSMHPLVAVTGADSAPWDGAAAAVAGSSTRALVIATELATRLGLAPVTVREADRSAYHAAASMASNYLVTLECAAERLAASAGVQREPVVALVRGAVENWARRGAQSLTGPVARGDEQTVTRQRAAVAERAPDLLAVFDSLTDATRALAHSGATT